MTLGSRTQKDHQNVLPVLRHNVPNIMFLLQIVFFGEKKTFSIMGHYSTIFGATRSVFELKQDFVPENVPIKFEKKISKEMRLLWCLRVTGRLDKKLRAMTLTSASRSWKGHKAMKLDSTNIKFVQYIPVVFFREQKQNSAAAAETDWKHKAILSAWT